MNRKVLFADGLSEEGRTILESYPHLFAFEIYDGLNRADLLKKIEDVEVLSVRTRTAVDKEIIEHGKKLKLIARAGTGVDHIDLKAAESRKILVMNTSSANSISAAELTLGLLLSAARQIPKAFDDLKKGEWQPSKGIELHRKTAGLVGLGRVGRLVATRLQAFGMRVIATDPYKTQKYADEISVRLHPLEELLVKSDIVSLHLPLTDETRHLFDESRFSSMKRGSLLINTARGGVVHEDSLLKALNGGLLKSYATDVFEEEPLPKNHRFFDHPSIIMTPHIGAQTEEAQKRVNIDIATQIVNYFVNDEVENAVGSNRLGARLN
ncbi:MAG: D-3-phosphoglycerate dehydrogenase [Bacteriovoracaceae bacterium]|nr:D-3-phosphoglycerate dehydrogenase [Bacteriovoracaceae bacterium]